MVRESIQRIVTEFHDNLIGILGLKSAVAYLTRELGTDVRQWKYGLIHQVVFEHPLGPHSSIFE